MKFKSITLLAVLLASLNLQAGEEAGSPEKLSFSAEQEVQLTAVIDAIDLEARTVTLTGPLGNSRTLQAREDSTNIDKVKVGDKVDVRYIQNLTVQLWANDGLEPGQGALAIQGTSEEGETPAAMGVVSTVETAVVEDINLEANTFKLRWPNGEVNEYVAQDPENLKKGEVGDLVSITYTEAIALTLMESDEE
jgi:Cu/Ag efflux protein CusF